MFKHPILLSAFSKFTLFFVGLFFLGISGSLITDHVRTIASVREVSVPLVADLPIMERRKALLAEQVDLTELQNSLRIGSHEERMRVYVIPDEFDIDRLVALFEVLTLTVKKLDYIASTVSPIEFGEEVVVGDGVYALPISLRLSVRDDGLANIFNLFKLAGLVTIADALTEEEMTHLFERIEEENPAGIVALEQFISTDLLEYALDPRPSDDRLKRSFLGSNFLRTFEDVFSESLVADAKELLGGPLGHVLKQQKLWPMPFLTFEKILTESGKADGWQMLSIKFHAYRRSS